MNTPSIKVISKNPDKNFTVIMDSLEYQQIISSVDEVRQLLNTMYTDIIEKQDIVGDEDIEIEEHEE